MQQTVPVRRPLSLLARLRALLGLDAAGVGQSLVALFLNSSTSFVAGAFLGSITDTLSRLPGLLVLVPAAIGLRGNIFGSFGNRISTSIHAGTFRLSARRDTVLGQNVLAVGILTLALSLGLAVVAKAIAVGLGVPHTISLLDMATISIIGGVLASVVVLAATTSVTAGAVRYGWDLDNLAAPVVSVLGDVLTLPALYVATFCVGVAVVSNTVGVVLVVASLGILVVGLRSRLEELRRIVRESLPVLLVAGAVSAMAGHRAGEAVRLVRGVPRAADPRDAAAVERRRARRHPLRPAEHEAVPRSPRSDPHAGKGGPLGHDVRGRAGAARVPVQRDRRALTSGGCWGRPAPGCRT